MASRDLAEAAARAEKRRELMKQQIPMRPYTPENLHISKAEFIARRRKQQEEDVAVEKYRQDLRAKKEEPKDGEKEAVPVAKVVKKRIKKVE